MRGTILFLLLLFPLMGGDYVVVISNKTSIKQVSKSLLKDIYLKKRNLWQVSK